MTDQKLVKIYDEKGYRFSVDEETIIEIKRTNQKNNPIGYLPPQIEWSRAQLEGNNHLRACMSLLPYPWAGEWKHPDGSWSGPVPGDLMDSGCGYLYIYEDLMVEPEHA